MCNPHLNIHPPDSVTHVAGYAFLDCPLLESITIPYAAINNPNFGVHEEYGYRDPFVGCTRLIAISAEANMAVFEYFRHLAQVKEKRLG